MAVSQRKKWADEPFKLCELIPNTDDETRQPYVRSANHMGAVHLGIIRYLNTIYLQAPQIPESEISNFIAYCLSWCKTMEVHHHSEETFFFPAVETECKLPGFLSHSVEQHKAFHDPFEKFKQYLQEIRLAPDRYDSAKLLQLIGGFAPILVEHLNDELQEIASIPDHLPKEIKPSDIDIEGLLNKTGSESMGGMAISTDITYFIMNNDKTYATDKIFDFPPAPYPIKLLYTYVTPYVSGSVNKFGCCDSYGRPREMPYAPLKE